MNLSLNTSMATNQTFSLNSTILYRSDVDIVRYQCFQYAFFSIFFSGFILSLYALDVYRSRSRYAHNANFKKYLHGMIESATIFYCVVMLAVSLRGVLW